MITVTDGAHFTSNDKKKIEDIVKRHGGDEFREFWIGDVVRLRKGSQLDLTVPGTIQQVFQDHACEIQECFEPKVRGPRGPLSWKDPKWVGKKIQDVDPNRGGYKKFGDKGRDRDKGGWKCFFDTYEEFLGGGRDEKARVYEHIFAIDDTRIEAWNTEAGGIQGAVGVTPRPWWQWWPDDRNMLNPLYWYAAGALGNAAFLPSDNLNDPRKKWEPYKKGTKTQQEVYHSYLILGKDGEYPGDYNDVLQAIVKRTIRLFEFMALVALGGNDSLGEISVAGLVELLGSHVWFQELLSHAYEPGIA